MDTLVDEIYLDNVGFSSKKTHYITVTNVYLRDLISFKNYQYREDKAQENYFIIKQQIIFFNIAIHFGLIVFYTKIVVLGYVFTVFIIYETDSLSSTNILGRHLFFILKSHRKPKKDFVTYIQS
jgi:hypothetical protein